MCFEEKYDEPQLMVYLSRQFGYSKSQIEGDILMSKFWQVIGASAALGALAASVVALPAAAGVQFRNGATVGNVHTVESNHAGRDGQVPFQFPSCAGSITDAGGGWYLITFSAPASGSCEVWALVPKEGGGPSGEYRPGVTLNAGSTVVVTPSNPAGIKIKPVNENQNALRARTRSVGSVPLELQIGCPAGTTGVWSLKNAPGWLSIDSAASTLNWAAPVFGTHTVTVVATCFDSNSIATSQTEEAVTFVIDNFAWTRDVGNGTVLMYARDVVGAGKVQFFHNGREIGWVRAVDATDPKLNVATDGFVRTRALVAGRNVFEIFVDGERVVRRIATGR
jgi:hypothetical protein